MSEIKVSCEALRQVEEICRKFHNDPGELITILHETQNTLGYLPEAVQRVIARELGISAQKVYGVVTFYSFFSMVPKGKYPVSVCLGTACYVRGSDKVLEEFKRVLGIEVGETTPDGKFSLDCLRCVGACGLEGVTENFDKESVGVVWMRFVGGTPDSHVYLFKDMPEIEHALTSSDRVRLREEKLKLSKNPKAAKSEVAFQFLTPRLTDFGDLTVFAVEAFMPYYHTETRMSYGYYGYYGGYPYTYTIFDGYDFFSEVLLAFDREGNLKWQQSVKFDNELTYDLFPHASEGVCYDELVVASPYHNNLRYTAFDKDAQVLMNQQSEKLAPTHGGDFVEDEYFAQMAQWYGNRFLIYGSQIIQNSTQPQAKRSVFYPQKVQYD